MVSCTGVLLGAGLLSLLLGARCHWRLSLQLSNTFCSFLPRLCGNYAPSYNLTFLSSQNVMLVTLITNKEGRFPGFKAEFFQLPKTKGGCMPWPSFPQHLSARGSCGCSQFARDVSRAGRCGCTSHFGFLSLPCPQCSWLL